MSCSYTYSELFTTYGEQIEQILLDRTNYGDIPYLVYKAPALTPQLGEYRNFFITISLE